MSGTSCSVPDFAYTTPEFAYAPLIVRKAGIARIARIAGIARKVRIARIARKL